MKKHIMLFGAGKSATWLIRHLLQQCTVNDWQLTVADSNLDLALSKIGTSSSAAAVSAHLEDEKERSRLVETADIIISLLPPTLHYLVAIDCLKYGKNLLTASYMDEKISLLDEDIKKKKLLFLCEMGLDPGIDHMSAMSLIHRIKTSGAKIHSFRSHCGGLVAPESDDNPLHYKISWNPRNIVIAGSSGAIYKENNQLRNKSYNQLYEDCPELQINALGKMAYYPNRDSLSYVPVYKLEEASTFIRTTLRHPSFCRAWDAIVKSGLTNAIEPIGARNKTFRQWSEKILPFVNENNKEQFDFLGLFNDEPLPETAKTNADVLQFLLERKLAMGPLDKDMVVMLHQVDFEYDNKMQTAESLLVVRGNDNVFTAMAKTVGLPLAIAARLILQGKIALTGAQIPVLPEIYIPVLKELEAEGIVFKETVF